MADSPYSGASTRRNIVAFLIGKVPTALLTASILALCARYLTAAEFGRYVVMIATLEIVLGLSTFGLDWIILRFLPGYRLHGTRKEIARLIGCVAVSRALVLAVVSAGLTAMPRLFPNGIGQLPFDLIGPFAMLVVVEGITRVIRDNTMEALAIQSRLQIAMIAKSLVILSVLLLYGPVGAATAEVMLYAEMGGAATAVVIAAGFVAATIRALRNERGDWQPASLRAMLRVAFYNYGSGICEYLFSPSFLILLMGKFLPAPQVAGVGFVLRFTELIRAYLPGMLVYGLVRSRLIGAYARDRNFEALRVWAGFLFKVSLLTLLPVIGIAVIYGRQVLELASSGRYGDYQPLFVALTVWLAFRLHRVILAVVFNAIDLMHAWTRVCLYSLITVPVLVAIGPARLGTWFFGLALLVSEIVMNILAVRALKRDGRDWKAGWGWQARAVAAMAAACAVTMLLPAGGWGVLAAGSVLLCILYAGMAFGLQVFDRADQALVNRSTGRRIFRNA